MKTCPSCRRELPELNRYCTQCGQRLDAYSFQDQPPATETSAPQDEPDSLNLRALYGMAGALILAVIFPPWETPPSQEPEFLGLRFVLDPPAPDAIISRLLLTIELVTIAIAGLYGAFLFRKK
ncbi:MAG: zinc ribbon domain-containing protein [Nitrospira sp.]|nr:zinc ribbon domain-containing protein [Nitrospira sp.]